LLNVKFHLRSYLEHGLPWENSNDVLNRKTICEKFFNIVVQRLKVFLIVLFSGSHTKVETNEKHLSDLNENLFICLEILKKCKVSSALIFRTWSSHLTFFWDGYSNEMMSYIKNVFSYVEEKNSGKV